MKLFVFVFSTTLSIMSGSLLGVNGQGQYGNNNGLNPGYAPQGNAGNPWNEFYHGIRNQISSSLLKPNVYNVYGTGSGLPQYQDQWANHQQQPQGGYQNQFHGNPYNQQQQNQGQYFNDPNSYQQHGGGYFPTNPQQNYQGPQTYNSIGQPPVLNRDNVSGQQNNVQAPQIGPSVQQPVQQQNVPVPLPASDALPVSVNSNNAPRIDSNLSNPSIPPSNPQSPQPQPNNIPTPNNPSENIGARQELNGKPNGVNPSASDANSEDASILKEFNDSL